VSARACAQVPIPVLVASVAWRLKTRGWKAGHRELATTPTTASPHHSLSSLRDNDDDPPHPHHPHHHQHHQHHHHQQACPGNEYGAVTPTRNGLSAVSLIDVSAYRPLSALKIQESVTSFETLTS